MAVQPFPATESLERAMRALGERARAAAATLATVPTEAKDKALRAAAAAIRRRQDEILAANRRDIAESGDRLSPAMRDRLEIQPKGIEAMARGLEEVAALPDPVGKIDSSWTRPNGLAISRVRVPLGVIGIIYESRPNVTADAAGLCLKAGNAAILRGGSESAQSSRAILAALHEGIAEAGLPQDAIQLVPTQDRAAVGLLLRLDEFVDVIIPRGGKALIERVAAESRIPVLKHLDGICHVYLDAAADPAKARAIVLNAKMRRTGVCGAAETLLVDRPVAAALLPPILDDLIAAGCEIRGDAAVRALDPRAIPATEEDWSTEYLAPILSVAVVDGVDAAIAHIGRHGSHHTESIVTEDEAAAERFLARIDSAILLWNASTQFADGGEFGMGAEIGISTGKLHARGPVGVNELTSYKYLVRGNGQVRPLTDKTRLDLPPLLGDRRHRRVGLLGGSFNPAHDGHLHVSREALKRLRLDEIWWLVSPQNPLKPVAGMASLADRLVGARNVAGMGAHIRVTDLEARLGTRYTADTLAALRRRFPRTRFVWLMGADNLRQISRWDRWERIFALAPIAVFDGLPILLAH